MTLKLQKTRLLGFMILYKSYSFAEHLYYSVLLNKSNMLHVNTLNAVKVAQRKYQCNLNKRKRK